ncbi:hypothetical protein Hbl1158_15595 (plasmid) [Halobaculum sp. CBA1158]|uniref:hypothetical protein n=1 Tax=Halobaculum sp. CBA1158 TaxID=2904243 RepID=UPI001F1E943B|nr:hypothetical protein [Halobaculum sp. CBA1158]UIP01335.1 hypothetical protein Hbl1158_15595 [Halobaculum sp. CBA1158]
MTTVDGVDGRDGVDPARCGCAGKTPLERVVLPARARVADALADTTVSLGPDADAAVIPASATPPATAFERETDAVALDGTRPRTPFGGDDRERPVTTVACAFLGGDLADPDRLGDALATAYAGLDGPPVRIGKGHAVQVPGATGGTVWFEHRRARAEAGGTADGIARDAATGVAAESPVESAAGDGAAAVAANVDAVRAFPGISPAESARIAALNALNDAHAVGATTDRSVRPLVATPRDETPDPDRVREWYRSGLPSDVTVRAAAVLAHDGDGWFFGASASARGDRPADVAGRNSRSLPVGCEVLVTRPLGGLACFARGVARGDEGLEARGLTRLGRDTRPEATALSAFRPAPRESFDPAEHVARVTDVSGEGIAGIGRLAAGTGRSLRLDRLPLLDGAASATDWTVPDATVETNGPLAVVATPRVLDRVADRLHAVEGADPRRIGAVVDAAATGDPVAGDAPVVDATAGDLTAAVEAASRWPSIDPVGTDGGDADA